MKTAYLNEIGISDQSVIDKIMAENGRDIEKAKKDYDTLLSKIEGLETQLNERDSQLKELKKSAKDNETLTAKIAELEESNANTKTEYEKKIADIQKDYEVETKLRDAKAKNLKAVRALLNMEDDVDKQIKALQTGEDTAFLFEQDSTPGAKPPAGTTPSGSKTTPSEAKELTFAQKIANAMKG